MPLKQPSEEEIATRAYENWNGRGRGHGFDNVDWFTAAQQLIIEQNYTLVASKNFDDSCELDFDDSAGLKCRYCGKSEPEVTFNSVGHAISRNWGANLISKDECDTCNHDFFNKYESIFGEWSLPLRRFMRTDGYEGPKPVLPADISVQPDGTKVFANTVDGIKDVCPNEAILNPERVVMILKILTKFGLAIMPPDLLSQFAETKNWILKQDHTDNPDECCRLITFLSRVKAEQGHWQEGISKIELYLANENFPIHSGTLLCFRTGPLAFQLPIPLSSTERLRHKSNTLPIPQFAKFDSSFGKPKIVHYRPFLIDQSMQVSS